MLYCNSPNLGLNRNLGVLCAWVKLLTDLQILGYELHKNVFVGRAPPRPARGAIALPRHLAGIRGEGGKGRKWLGMYLFIYLFNITDKGPEGH